MVNEGYVSVAIPSALTKRIERIIEQHPELGIRNRNEFVIEAVRRHATELETHLMRLGRLTV